MVGTSRCSTVVALFYSIFLCYFLKQELCLFVLFVYESGNLDELRKQEDVGTTIGTPVLMTMTFRGNHHGYKFFSSHIQMQWCKCGVTGGQDLSRGGFHQAEKH